MIDRLLSAIAPHLCCGCGKIGTILCDSCKYDILNDEFGLCVACDEPAASYLCRRHSGVVDQGWYVAERAGTLQHVIDQYKFYAARSASRELADLLVSRLPELPSTTIVVPIPTVPGHIRQRGYDHMARIGRQFARMRRLTYVPVLVRRTTTKQRDAGRTLRFKQAAQAFAVHGAVDPARPYLIIDDVATTGATLLAAAAALRNAGAETVYVAAIARQPLD
jgi:ComF family protein